MNSYFSNNVPFLFFDVFSLFKTTKTRENFINYQLFRIKKKNYYSFHTSLYVYLRNDSFTNINSYLNKKGEYSND